MPYCPKCDMEFVEGVTVCTDCGGPLVESREAAQAQKAAEKEKREPLLIRDFSVHNLRHTFCTRFCENETNLKVIQEIMGHSDISTTMNIYAEATA
mgnify:CR=1 FL=1